MDRIYISSLVVNLGGKPSRKLINLLADKPNLESDEVLKVKLQIAFSSGLKIDYIHLIVEKHFYQKIANVKPQPECVKLGKILSKHFSEKKVFELISTIDDRAYIFYLENLSDFYDKNCLFLDENEMRRRLHRHLKNIRQLAIVLSDVLLSSLQPDSELDLQKKIYFAINNRFLKIGYQIYIPTRYGELRRISHVFNNCLGSPIVKKQIEEKEFAIVVFKKDNKFICLAAIYKNYTINNIKMYLNTNLKADEHFILNESWNQEIIPILIKKSVVF